MEDSVSRTVDGQTDGRTDGVRNYRVRDTADGRNKIMG